MLLKMAKNTEINDDGNIGNNKTIKRLLLFKKLNVFIKYFTFQCTFFKKEKFELLLGLQYLEAFLILFLL